LTTFRFGAPRLLINSKSFFKNLKGKVQVPRGRGGANMFSPGSISEDGSIPAALVVTDLTEVELTANVVPEFKCSEVEISIKQNILVHISSFEESFGKGQFNDFFTEKPPAKLDDRNSKKPDKVAQYAKMSENHNYGNKSCHAVILLSGFDSSRSTQFDSLSDVPGAFEAITVHARLLYQVLCLLVPSWKSKVDQTLLFRKLKVSLTNDRANMRKAE